MSEAPSERVRTSEAPSERFMTSEAPSERFMTSEAPSERFMTSEAPSPRISAIETPSGLDVSALRPDLQLIADWIPPGTQVLDLACGDGSLMAWLQANKGCMGYGVEIDDAEMLACTRRGVNVIQRDIEAGLGMFRAGRFDVVVLSMAIQVTHRTEFVLREMSEVGREGIVSFPNFGHWRHAWSLLRGRMPVSRAMPYQWYDTPNLHLATVPDFEDFLAKLGLRITGRAFLADGKPVRSLPALRATQAIYRFRRAAP